MKLKNLIQCLCSLFVVAAALNLQAQTPANTAGESIILSMQGTVEVAKSGSDTWSSAQESQALKSGDRVRTSKNSRATIRLSNLSILRVHELTTLEIQPPQEADGPPTLNLKVGSTYFFNRDKPNATQFRTPAASGAIRGTEFNMMVAEDGRMLLTLIDGEVNLQNEIGALELHTGEQASVAPGEAPKKTAAVDSINVIQWTLYYPAVLDPDELGLSEDLKVQLAPSLSAYRSGDMVKAMESYPFDRESQSPEDKVYRAQLLLAAGNVEQAQMLLQNLGEGHAPMLAEAIGNLIAAVKGQAQDCTTGTLASHSMACSYVYQSRGELEMALQAARAAAAKNPNNGYAHARIAELEFSFGNVEKARDAMEESIKLSPRNAQAHSLGGFLLAAENRIDEAREAFDRAIEIDGALGNAWLGRGLTRIKKGDVDGGRKDLETAAALEPNRAIFRSYLGKAWSLDQPFRYTWNKQLADKELDLSKRLDPNDPTAWLYSALLNQQRNQVNRAVEDLEKSENLNQNRGVFRSKMLLDQDRAVRSANLASIYRDVGMQEYSVRTASRAVEADPANSSAHLFLSESYDALRDPNRINLRYETPWMNELLLANLLAPVGAGNLSQNISQQEYSRLFETDRLGLFSRTEYASNGDWLQQASQFGTFGNSSYALDVDYQSNNGWRVNNDSELLYLSAKFKQQITAKDSVFLQITAQEAEAGFVSQLYDQDDAKRFGSTLRTEEEQQPNLFAGYHREWAPGHHTLFLFSRLDSEFKLTDQRSGFYFATLDQSGVPIRMAGPGFSIRPPTGSMTNESEFEAYSFELQQMADIGNNTIIGGVRFQTGEIESSSEFSGSFRSRYNDTVESDVKRFSVYLYDYWQIIESLQLSAGLTYDHVRFPVNTDVPPLSGREESEDQISPKVGLRYTPWKDTTFRAAYTRSLGGLSLDQSVRLEPSQIAGFTQAYRSIIPESVVGQIPGSEFTTYGVGVEQRFATRTYLTITAEQLESEADRSLGAFGADPTVGGIVEPVSLSFNERLEYRERSLTFTANQLLGEDWAVGARYRISDAELDDRLAIPVTQTGVNRDSEATLHQANAFVLYNHRCGFFARSDATWASQSNDGFENREGDDFWQFHALAGYRFPRRHAEVRVGVLNIFDQDYQLNPINFYLDYPRERTFVASLKINF
jgi:tetratricopeptide (TPR) repeat protein